ncbi:MAG: hypothetical protein K2X07_05015 [Caulobacteraceae bacterium]|nr:hypothetical protein [Caulobacteraceae bacterium]
MTDSAPKLAETKRPKMGRSPSYPSVDLATAIEKAKAQYDIEGKYAVPLPSAFKSWGYSDKSSGGRDLRASLRYFGLITVEGDGAMAKVKLTEDALRVLLDGREDQTEKKAIIRRLALNPTAHKKLWAKFPEGIKSEATAVHYLVFEEKFNTGAAEQLIAQFKATADFAGLYQPDTIVVIKDPGGDGDDHVFAEPGGEDEARRDRLPPPPAPKGQVAVMSGERVAFTEESQPGQYLKLIASGEVDDMMLEALEDFVKRQRKRLKAVTTPTVPN